MKVLVVLLMLIAATARAQTTHNWQVVSTGASYTLDVDASTVQTNGSERIVWGSYYVYELTKNGKG